MPSAKRRRHHQASQATDADAGTQGSTPSDLPPPIVGIGASAGGLDALERLFDAMPADIGMAFVILQHQDPARKSALPEILARHTAMPVLTVEDGQRPQAGHIYVATPMKNVSVANGAIRLSELQPGLRLPIDAFFRSLAGDQRERAIGIVLSGTGTDGTLGVRAIKEQNGLVLVQSPSSVQYDGMPNSAIATGLVDFILEPEQMGRQLQAIAKVAPRRSTDEVPPHELDEHLKAVFELLRQQTGHDFSHYKKSTILRRIERRMGVHQVARLADYVALLKEDGGETRILLKNILIGVTSFFRDPEVFEALRTVILPAVLSRVAPDAAPRIWVVGCSTGEEAYSMAILIREVMREKGRELKPQIFATDIDKSAIEFARDGIYPENIAADVAPDRLRTFFVHDSKTYRVKKSLRDLIVFAEQSVTRDPPFSHVDLITCRNLLIYLEPGLQRNVLSTFHYSLNQDGYIVLGTSETVGDMGDAFRAIDRKHRVFQRRETGSSRRTFSVPPMLPNGAGGKPLPTATPITPVPPNFKELVEAYLQQHFPLACVVVDDRWNALYFHGRTGRFFEPAAGRASLDILEMAREGLNVELGAALRQVRAKREAVHAGNVHVRTNGGFDAVDVTVAPFVGPDADQNLYIVVFADHQRGQVTPPERVAGAPTPATERRVAELEQELRATREHLQTTIEELQTANEEQRSTNEELQSANEELQSTNEELETSKEEAQSVNEELVTVNAELESRIAELWKTNNDMANLLAGTQIGTIFLGTNLCVLRYTPAAAQIVNLIPADVGRPLGHIASNLDYQNLVKDAQAVLDTLAPVHHEAKATTDGQWYSIKMVPYRTADNKIDGVVITFFNIHEQKVIEGQLRKFQAAVEQSASIVMICNADGGIEFVNRRYFEVTGYPPEEVIGRNWSDLRQEDDAMPYFDDMWRTVVSGSAWRGEARVHDRAGRRYWEAVQVSPIADADGHITHFVAVKDVITERKEAQLLQTRDAEADLRRLTAVMQDSNDAVMVLDGDGRILQWNRGAELLYGYDEAGATKLMLGDLVPPAASAAATALLESLRGGRPVRSVECERLTRDGRTVRVLVTATFLDDPVRGRDRIVVTERQVGASISDDGR